MIEKYILEHPAAAVMVLSIVGTAFASTFPENRPKNLDDLWAWISGFVHQIGNARPTKAVLPTPKQ